MAPANDRFRGTNRSAACCSLPRAPVRPLSRALRACSSTWTYARLGWGVRQPIGNEATSRSGRPWVGLTRQHDCSACHRLRRPRAACDQLHRHGDRTHRRRRDPRGSRRAHVLAHAAPWRDRRRQLRREGVRRRLRGGLRRDGDRDRVGVRVRQRAAARTPAGPAPASTRQAPQRRASAQGTTIRNSHTASRIRCTMPDSRLARPVP